jgi:hypothetical protein
VDPDDSVSGTDSFMTADYNVSCSSLKYRFGLIWACAMVAVYPLGCPLGYFYLLFRVRHEIQTRDESLVQGDEEDASCLEGAIRGPQEALVSLRFLYESYEPRYWWWEIVETSQRILLTGVLVLISQGSALQIIVGALLTLLFLHLYARYEPFCDSFVLSIKIISYWQIFFVFWIALLVKADFPSISSGALGVCLIFTVFANIIFDLWKVCRASLSSSSRRQSRASPVRLTSDKKFSAEDSLPPKPQTEMGEVTPRRSAESSSSPFHLSALSPSSSPAL